MKLEERMLRSLQRRTGAVVLRSDVAHMGSPSQVSEGLKALIRRGVLVRLGAGIYARAKKDPASDTAALAGEPDAVAQEVFTRLGVTASLQRDGDKDCLVLDTGARRINRRLALGGHTVTYLNDQVKKARARALVKAAKPSGQLQPPTEGVSRYVAELARRHDVRYIRTFADQWAESATRLADDDVQSDDTGDLLVALRRADKLSDREMTSLLINHLREKKRVRSL